MWGVASPCPSTKKRLLFGEMAGFEVKHGKRAMKCAAAGRAAICYNVGAVWLKDLATLLLGCVRAALFFALPSACECDAPQPWKLVVIDRRAQRKRARFGKRRTE